MTTPIEIAFARHQANRLDEAEAMYRDILDADGEHLNALQLLGALLLGRGQSGEAVALLDRATEIFETSGGEDGQHAVLRYNLGNARKAAGRGDAAAAYRRARDLAPGAAEFHAALAGELAAQGDFPAAAEGFEAALALAPGHADWRRHLATILAELGRAAREAGRTDEAETALRRALASAPDHPEALFGLGLLLNDARKNPAGAIALYERLIAAAPDHVEVHAALGAAWRALGGLDRAVESYDRYLALSPDSAAARFQLGRALAEAGRNAEAAPHLRRAIDLDRTGKLSHLTHLLLAGALQKLGRAEEAWAEYRHALAREPVVTLKSERARPDFSALFLLAPGLANTPYETLVRGARYDAHFVLLVPGAEHDAAALRSRGDVVVNLISDADQDRALLPAAAALIERLGKPAINRPEMILRTDRASVAALLTDVPGCRIANIRRHAGSDLLVPGFLATAGAPFLLRRCGGHNGDDFERVETHADLARFVSRDPAADYYAIPYLDTRSPDGFFRKYRFFFVGGAVLPYHLAIGANWKVHHVNTDMANHAWMKREEEAFLRAPGDVFGYRQMAALRAIADAVGLEFFGVDCALDAAGDVVVFEANATMLIHEGDVDFPYRDPYVRAIEAAFDGLLAARARSVRLASVDVGAR